MENSSSSNSTILKEFFNEQISIALNQRKVEAYPMVASYLVGVLEAHMFSERIENETLAELYLRAMSESSSKMRVELLKRLGDKSLYISGFFGDSLKRKVVDIDYYAELGGRAYEHLSVAAMEDTVSRVYKDISSKFLAYVDVLTIVSQNAMVQTNEDLLRLYDRYVSTGSDLARDQLLEKGLLPPQELKQKKKQ